MSTYTARKLIVAGSLVLAVAAIQVARGWHRGWGAIAFSALVIAAGLAGLRGKS